MSPQRWNAVVAALCATLLAACAAQPPRSDLPPVADPQAHQRQREAALAAAPVWSLAGRVALSNGRDGGSGRIDWMQDGARFDVSLSAPVTRQSWRLSGEPGKATLEGLDGGPHQGADAQTLLREATGWEIPVQALAGWVRGARADVATFGAERAVFGENGHISRLVQGGWTIDYSDWRAVPGQRVELPHRLNAVRGEAKVRLIVDAWPPPAAASAP